MAYTEAHKRATIKYLAEKTDDIRLRVPKGTKERWRRQAEKAGKSMTAYVCETVDGRSDREEAVREWIRSRGHDPEELLQIIYG